MHVTELVYLMYLHFSIGQVVEMDSTVTSPGDNGTIEVFLIFQKAQATLQGGHVEYESSP